MIKKQKNMETIKSFKNPFEKLDGKICESCRHFNMVGWPLMEVFVQDENKKMWLCENCLDKIKKDESIDEVAEALEELDEEKEADILENRDNFESPDS